MDDRRRVSHSSDSRPILLADTLIVWQEPDTQRDVALSFQESAGCMEVWYAWCARQWQLGL